MTAPDGFASGVTSWISIGPSAVVTVCVDSSAIAWTIARPPEPNSRKLTDVRRLRTTEGHEHALRPESAPGPLPRRARQAAPRRRQPAVRRDHRPLRALP